MVENGASTGRAGLAGAGDLEEPSPISQATQLTYMDLALSLGLGTERFQP